MRNRLYKKKDRKVFQRTADRAHKKNLTYTVPRGGIRL